MAELVEIISPRRQKWAKRLNGQWDHIRDTAVDGFIQLGRDLHAAKAELEHGEWTGMLVDDLNFPPRIAQIFKRIATWIDQKQVDDSYLPELLPPDYNTINVITRLDDETCTRLIEDGTICPTAKRGDISKILRLQRVKADERRILDLRPIEGKFHTLVFDPAWEYDWLSLAGRAKPGYAMQTLDQLRALDIKQWAEPDCELYVWTTNNFMYEACKLVDGWGFQHRTLISGRCLR